MKHIWTLASISLITVEDFSFAHLCSPAVKSCTSLHLLLLALSCWVASWVTQKVLSQWLGESTQHIQPCDLQEQKGNLTNISAYLEKGSEFRDPFLRRRKEQLLIWTQDMNVYNNIHSCPGVKAHRLWRWLTLGATPMLARFCILYEAWNVTIGFWGKGPFCCSLFSVLIRAFTWDLFLLGTDQLLS